MVSQSPKLQTHTPNHSMSFDFSRAVPDQKHSAVVFSFPLFKRGIEGVIF